MNVLHASARRPMVELMDIILHHPRYRKLPEFQMLRWIGSCRMFSLTVLWRCHPSPPNDLTDVNHTIYRVLEIWRWFEHVLTFPKRIRNLKSLFRDSHFDWALWALPC